MNPIRISTATGPIDITSPVVNVVNRDTPLAVNYPVDPLPPQIPTGVPVWPVGICTWWFDVQVAALKDAVSHFMDGGQCANLSVILSPWLQTPNQIGSQVAAQSVQHDTYRRAAEDGISKLTQGRQGIIAQSVKNLLQQLMAAVKTADRQSTDYFRQMVDEDKKLFRGLLLALKWLVKSNQLQKQQVTQEKALLHQQLPASRDPITVAKQQGSCLESIRSLRERYLQFVSRLAESSEMATCVKEKLLGVELTLSNTDNQAVLLDIMLRSTDDISGCLEGGQSDSDAAENQQFKAAMQTLQKQCGESVAGVAMKLASIQEAHSIVDIVATDVLENMAKELESNVYNISTDVAKRMAAQHELYLNKLTTLEETFQKTVENMLATMVAINREVMQTDPALHTAVVNSAYATELVVSSYYNYQAYRQIARLLQDGQEYCDVLKHSDA